MPGEWVLADGKVVAREHLVWMSQADLEALTETPLAAQRDAQPVATRQPPEEERPRYLMQEKGAPRENGVPLL